MYVHRPNIWCNTYIGIYRMYMYKCDIHVFAYMWEYYNEAFRFHRGSRDSVLFKSELTSWCQHHYKCICRKTCVVVFNHMITYTRIILNWTWIQLWCTPVGEERCVYVWVDLYRSCQLHMAGGWSAYACSAVAAVSVWVSEFSFLQADISHLPLVI